MECPCGSQPGDHWKEPTCADETVGDETVSLHTQRVARVSSYLVEGRVFLVTAGWSFGGIRAGLSAIV